MVIVLDLDNTLFYNDVVEKVATKYDLPLTEHYDLSDYPVWARDLCFKMFKEEKHMHNLQPFDGVAEKLQEWSDEGHDLYCVTARSKCFTNPTKAMVKEHYPMIKETYLCESYDKSDVYEELAPDLIIDDHFDYFIQATNLNIPYMALISNEKTRYNHKYIPLCARLVGCRVFSSIADVHLPFEEYNKALTNFIYSRNDFLQGDDVADMKVEEFFRQQSEHKTKKVVYRRKDG